MAKRRFLGILAFCFLLQTAACCLKADPLQDLPQIKQIRTMRSSSSDPNWQNGNWDARPIPVGKTLVIADLQGPGKITHIWCTIASQDKFYPRLLTLRIYWDDEKDPSVECPIGDFFAVGHGLDAMVNSLPVRVTSHGRARNCYWPMPFRKRARIEVTNDGFRNCDAFYFYVDWQKLKSLPKETAYFHAQYRQEFPCQPGRNYLILDAVGKGHYVGTVLSVRCNEPSWWGEGDDFFFVDGEKEPSLRGTGSEDYFCDAWGLMKMDGLYYGCPVMEGLNTGDRTTAYRWHITDPVVFTKSLRVEIEHKGARLDENGRLISGFTERADDFASVAFWYQLEPHKRFTKIPPGRERILYEPNHVVEAETLLNGASGDPRDALKTQEGGYSGGSQVWFTPPKDGGRFELPFEVKETGNYELILGITQSWDYGIYQAYLDSTPIGVPFDGYAPQITPSERLLGRLRLEKGRHALRFEARGKNPLSAGYFAGIDFIVLIPKRSGALGAERISQ